MIDNGMPGIMLGRASPEEIRKDFAKRLLDALVNKGWNQSELARHAGESRDNISNYVNAKALPLPHRLKKIADALGMAGTDLIPPRDATMGNETFFEAKNEGDLMRLRVNQRVSWDQFIRIAAILKESGE